MRDAGHRTPDAGHRTSDGGKSKNNISTPQGGGHNNTLVWFQIKVLYRVIGTRSYLCKLRLVDSSNCVHCGENEIIVHMFVECENVKKIWRWYWQAYTAR